MKKRVLAMLMAVAIILSAFPIGAFAAVPESQRPRNPSSGLVIGILNDSRASEPDSFPNEPSITGYDYYYVQANGSLSTSWSNVYLTRTGASNYINTDTFWDDSRLVRNYSGNAFGFYSPTGIAMDDPCLVQPFPIDQTTLIRNYLNAQGLRNENPDDYRLLFYVLKYETGYSEGYHLDCKVVRKNNLSLSYDANKPAGVTADVTVPISHSVAPNTSVSVSDMPQAGKTLVGTDGLIYTFDGWNTAANGSGTDYVADNNITVTQNTVLYAQWKVANTYTVTWVNHNNLTLETDNNVPYGAKVDLSGNSAAGTVNYGGNTPTKAADSHYTYEFSGWSLYEGSYNDTTGVTGNVTFQAQFTPKAITHSATVQVILNDSFDAEGKPTQSSGATFENITSMEPTKAGENTIYLKAADGEYIPLTATVTGIYSKSDVANGTYHIYVRKDGTYTQIGTQSVTIENADQVAYLPYYSVTYEANVPTGAGSATGIPDVEYYYIGSHVDVSGAVPALANHTFEGWKDIADNNTVYQPSTPQQTSHLTDNIARPYTLQAQWKAAATVNVTVVVDHGDRVGDPTGDLSLHLTAKGANNVYNEVLNTQRTVGVVEWNSNIDVSGTVATYYAEPYTGLDSTGDYGAHAAIPGYKYDTNREGGYIVISSKEGNVTDVTLYLVYDPVGYELPFTVEIAPDTADTLIPDAVDVRVTRWNATKSVWEPIPQHKDQTVEVVINQEKTVDGKTVRYGTGSVHVWGFYGQNAPYLYRIEVVRGDLDTYQLDAEAVEQNVSYRTKETSLFPQGAYTAVVDVKESDLFDDGNSGLPGAHAKRNADDTLSYHGSIVATVTAHPYTVELDPNGGQWAENDTDARSIPDRFTVPNLSGYVPTREGYTFTGWSYGNKVFTGTEAIKNYVQTTGGALHLDAQWVADITVEGKVVIDLGFPCSDTGRMVEVSLQMRRESGSYVDSDYLAIVNLTPVAGTNYAVGDYEFTNVPGTGTYRVQAVVPAGGTVTYQNEPESTVDANLYAQSKYNANDFIAEDQDNNDIAVVNLYLEATPFALAWRADASAIGKDFRPQKLELDLRHDHRTGGTVTYEVIKKDLEVTGLDQDTDGISTIRTIKVPPYHANGYLYDYVISLVKYGDTKYYHDAATPGYIAAPFVVRYTGPANYSANGITVDGTTYQQDLLLQAILEPNRYPITYDLDGGSWPSASEVGPSEHTWSYVTNITVEPVREGYLFTGWTAEPNTAFDAQAKQIPASVWEPVKLTANWEKDTWNDQEDRTDKGDQIPDSKQAVMTFASIDETTGTVSGKTVQVFTLTADNSGAYVGQVTAETVTATAAENYEFEKWTKDDGTGSVDPFAAQTVQGGQYIRYYAHFVGDGTGGQDTPQPPKEPQNPVIPVFPFIPAVRPALNTEDHYSYIIGYPDGTVKPAGQITRAEVATIFFRLLTDESRDAYWASTNPYTDVPADKWYNNAISTLSNAGILGGYPDGTFRPDAPITRAEFAKIAVSFFAYVDGSFRGLYPDVTVDKWYASYVEAASQLSLITGYPDGTFRPEQFITRAEACTIVNRTIDRRPHEEHLLADMIVWPDNPAPGQVGHQWYYEQIQEATNSHEYVMRGGFEEWTELLENRNWSALEKLWSDSYSSRGPDVID